jgi:hypothetical protein
MNKYEVNTKVYSAGDAPAESDQVELDLVKLPKTWALWEGYEPGKEQKENKDEDWKRSIKLVFEFGDIITFWQLWNNSPFSKFSDIFNNGERIR